MNKKIIVFSVILMVVFPVLIHAQDDAMQRMMDSISNLEKVKKEFVIATFKTTRLIDLQTTETAGKHSLDYRIQHRVFA